MRFLRISFPALLAAVLCGCAPIAGDESPDPSPARHSFPIASLLNAELTIADPSVRSELVTAGRPFVVRLQHGQFRFPPSYGMTRYPRLSVDDERIVYGDINGDGSEDAVLPVVIGSGESLVTELAAFTLSGSAVRHFASFPLGHATLKSVSVEHRGIRVNFTHTVPGDPGPRNTELLLELPEE